MKTEVILRKKLAHFLRTAGNPQRLDIRRVRHWRGRRFVLNHRCVVSAFTGDVVHRQT
jgi:hypothetical protein